MKASRVFMFVGGTGLAISVAALRIGAAAGETPVPRQLSGVSYTTSSACLPCHPDHHRSWSRTFHRTMTQVANQQSVVGDFNGASLDFGGIQSRFTSRGGRYLIDTIDGLGQRREYEVERTVGSRRVQQYVVREGDRFVRLPLAWNIIERRWFHLNGGFLDPDGTDFNAHRALWDGNCIFCHTVKANPGYDWTTGTFRSRSEELGIACEACHGPGAEHVARNSEPLRRYFLHYTDGPDTSIVNPRRLPKERRVQVCGHCHGQRVPNPLDRIRTLMSEGDPYTAGEDLSQYTTPIQRSSSVPGLEVKARFWGDGTPRLTAHEYQALTQSLDYQLGELTCDHCHSMHGGDPKGMLEDAKRGPSACVDCHADIVARASEHSRHRDGSDCYACHMPKITFGILEVHPTHRIQKPDPSRAWRFDMPEACTLCHLDRTARWAAESLAHQFNRPAPPDLPAVREAESVRQLLGGDVLQRAVAAMALGDTRSATPDPTARLWAIPFLFLTMEDLYPAVRFFAERSVRRLVARAPVPPLPVAFDPQADPLARERALASWRSWWRGLDKTGIPRPGPELPLDSSFEPIAQVVEALRRRAPEPTISIGE